jgi:hypothetical protein
VEIFCGGQPPAPAGREVMFAHGAAPSAMVPRPRGQGGHPHRRRPGHRHHSEGSHPGPQPRRGLPDRRGRADRARGVACGTGGAGGHGDGVLREHARRAAILRGLRLPPLVRRDERGGLGPPPRRSVRGRSRPPRRGLVWRDNPPCRIYATCTDEPRRHRTD